MKSLLVTLLSLFFINTASATVVTFTASLSGANESPANASPGTGMATFKFNDDAHTMTMDVIFSGLLGETTAAHVHCCTAVPMAGNVGVATVTPTFPGFPNGVTSGSYNAVFDLLSASSYNPAFIQAKGGVAGAEAAFLEGIATGRSYLNIHTRAFPGGEIRGFLVQVPEPGSVALFGLAAGGLLLMQRRRKSPVAPH